MRTSLIIWALWYLPEHKNLRVRKRITNSWPAWYASWVPFSKNQELGYSSMVAHLPNIHKTSGSVSQHHKRRKKDSCEHRHKGNRRKKSEKFWLPHKRNTGRANAQVRKHTEFKEQEAGHFRWSTKNNGRNDGDEIRNSVKSLGRGGWGLEPGAYWSSKQVSVVIPLFWFLDHNQAREKLKSLRKPLQKQRERRQCKPNW